jgi:glyoxylase-like metal-dependent hydrolase (beta-lactamase superfamily II)
MKIIPLSEGRFTIDASKIFIPFDSSKDDLYARPQGSLLVEIQPFVVIAGADIILLDTGLGFAGDSGMPQLHQNLIKQGIEPSKITRVLLSHLHKDHAGCILWDGKPAFENADYYINRQEMEYALEKGSPSYQIEQFEQISCFNKVNWIEGDGRINELISYETCGGHCPFHTIFWLRENGQVVFYGGDVAPQLQQMKTRFTTKYDFEPRRSMELRSKWWQQGKEEKWEFLFYHDISNPVISL